MIIQRIKNKIYYLEIHFKKEISEIEACNSYQKRSNYRLKQNPISPYKFQRF